MAIKGLTDKQAAFPSLGTLRKGEKKPDANRPGKDLTYFRFVSDDPLACKMFEQAYPDENSLRNINVFLPHKTTDENMDAWIEKWVAGGLVYRSDGETVVLWRDEKGRYSTTPKPDPAPEVGEDGKRADGSGQVGRLSVIVPDLGRFVTITVMTTSKHDIINLTRQLRGYEALRGDLRGIPFVLKRRQQNVSTPAGGGKRARREKWLLSIETQPAWSMAQLGAMEQAALPAGEIIDNPAEFVLELPEIISPFDESIDEPAIPQNEQESKLDKHLLRQEQATNTPHWATVEDNRTAIEAKLAEHNIPLYALFYFNGGMRSWDDMAKVTFNGRDALSSTVKKWEQANDKTRFYITVQQATGGYYNHPNHLWVTIGELKPEEEERQVQLSAAVDYVAMKNTPANDGRNAGWWAKQEAA